MKPLCVACGSDQTHFWFSKASAFDKERYKIFQCYSCKSAFVHPRPPATYIADYYERLSDHAGGSLFTGTLENNYSQLIQEEIEFPNSTADATRIIAKCKQFSVGLNFLDSGAGHGFFSKAAIKAEFNVTAIEPNRNARQIFARMNGFEACDGFIDEELSNKQEAQFDVILLSQVLEHVVEPHETILYLHKMLKKGGILAVAVPHFGSWLSQLQGRKDAFITPPEHLSYFSQVGLIYLFERHGFKCREITTISRIDIRRAARKLSLPIIGPLIARSASWFLSISDRFSRGMYINAYFEKLC